MRELLRNRNLRRLSLGQILGAAGDYVLFLALAVWAKDITGDNAAPVLVFVSVNAMFLLSPLAGVVVDRVRRRRLMIVSDLAAAVALLPLLLVEDAGDVWLLYAVSAAYGLAKVLHEPARSALNASVLPPHLLGQANATLRSIFESLRLGAPALGTALYVTLGGVALVVATTAIFMLSALSLTLVRTPDTPPERRAEPPLAALTEGVRHIWRHPTLRRLTLVSMLALGALGLSEATLFAVVGDGLGRPPGFVGVLSPLQGVGALLAGLAAAAIFVRLGEVRMVGLAFLLFAVSSALKVVPSEIAVGAAFLLVGLALPLLLSGVETSMQRRTPNELQGRVIGAAETLQVAPLVLCMLAGSALVDRIDFRIILGLMTVVLFLAALPLLRGRDAGSAPPMPSRHPAEPLATTPGTRGEAASPGDIG